MRKALKHFDRIFCSLNLASVFNAYVKTTYVCKLFGLFSHNEFQEFSFYGEITEETKSSHENFHVDLDDLDDIDNST